MFQDCLKVAIAISILLSPWRSFPVFASEKVLPNGVFFYGQSSQPDKIGQEYLVFEVQQNQVKGAIYLPSSEFNCFEGILTPQAMQISIADPYNDMIYPVQISLQREAMTASVTIPSPVVGLEGYYELDEVRDRDQYFLQTCLSE
jgi:hypothetical protein